MPRLLPFLLLIPLLATACTRPQRIGTSIESRPILAHTFGSGPTRFLVIGGIHGSEPTSAAVANELTTLLRENPSLARGLTVAVIPESNPDGLARKIRFNANRVDLNRNFPAANFKPIRTATANTGPSPLSEPESRALHDFILSFRPHALISIHSIDRNRECNNYDGPAGLPLAQAMAPHNLYPVIPNIGYPTPGSLGSWAGIDRNIPMVTLELPRTQPAPDAWQSNKHALLAALTTARSLPRPVPKPAAQPSPLTRLSTPVTP